MFLCPMKMFTNYLWSFFHENSATMLSQQPTGLGHVRTPERLVLVLNKRLPQVPRSENFHPGTICLVAAGLTLTVMITRRAEMMTETEIQPILCHWRVLLMTAVGVMFADMKMKQAVTQTNYKSCRKMKSWLHNLQSITLYPWCALNIIRKHSRVSRVLTKPVPTLWNFRTTKNGPRGWKCWVCPFLSVQSMGTQKHCVHLQQSPLIASS